MMKYFNLEGGYLPGLSNAMKTAATTKNGNGPAALLPESFPYFIAVFCDLMLNTAYLLRSVCLPLSIKRYNLLVVILANVKKDDLP